MREFEGILKRTLPDVNEHFDCIEWVMLNRFAIMTGSPIHRAMQRHPSRFPGVRQILANHAIASVTHHYEGEENRAYRKEVVRLLSAVHQVNRKHLRIEARQFEGVM